jgi:hypothetical protein
MTNADDWLKEMEEQKRKKESMRDIRLGFLQGLLIFIGATLLLLAGAMSLK